VDAVTKRKNPCPYQESSPGRPGRSPITILTELHRFILKYDTYRPEILAKITVPNFIQICFVVSQMKKAEGYDSPLRVYLIHFV
jgi:hypothetical protein